MLVAATASEKVTEGLVDQACTINDRMLNVPEVRELLLQAEDLPMGCNPIEGTSKLQMVVQKARSPQRIQIALEMVLDAARGGLMPNQPPVSAFAGTSPGAGGKGIVELLIHKDAVARYLVTVTLQSLNIDAHVKVIMPEVFVSAKTYREKCGYPGDEKFGQLSWRAGWSRATEAFYTLVESIKHDVVFDGHCKEAVKANLTPQETVELKFQENLTHIKQLNEEDVKETIDDDAEDAEDAGIAGAQDQRPPGDAVVTDDARAEDHTTPLTKLLTVDDDDLTVAAARLVSTHNTFLVDQGGNAQALAELIATTPAGKYICSEHGHDKKGYVMLLFDSTCIGQASSHPHLRKPVLQAQVIERVQKIALLARSKVHTNAFVVENLQPDDLWIVFDGGRAGYTDTKLFGGLRHSGTGQPLKKAKSYLTMTYDEDSVTENVGRFSSIASMPLVEVAHFASLEELNLPKRKRLHHTGSNLSNHIGPIHVTPWTDQMLTWHLSKKAKTSVLGRFIIPTGSGVDSESTVVDTADKFKNQLTEPVFFHTKPVNFADDIIHSYFGRAVIDFTPGSGIWALACIRRRVPYVGIVGSDVHRNELQKWLVQQIKRGLVDKDDPLYDKSLAESETLKQQQKKRTAAGQNAGSPAPSKLPAPKKPKTGGTPDGKKTELMDKLKLLMAGNIAEEPEEPVVNGGDID